jgi:hypothetical protein
MSQLCTAGRIAWLVALAALLGPAGRVAAQAAPAKMAPKPPRVLTEEEVFRLLMQIAPVPLPHHQPISSLTFSPDGRIVTTVSDAEASVFLWEAATGKLLHQVRLPMRQLDNSAVSRDGRRIAVADLASKVSVWDAATGKKIAVLPSASGPRVAIAPDGQSVAAGTPTGQLGIWDAATGKRRCLLRGSGGTRGQALAFSPDGKLLAATQADGSLGIWNTATGKAVRSIPAGVPAVQLLAFTPDSNRLAVSDARGPVRFWDVRAGKEGPQLPLPPGHVLTSARFSADGRTLLTGGADGSVRLWELATGAERHRFPTRLGGVACVAFANDGQTVAVAGDDQMALVRAVNPRGPADGAFAPPAPQEADVAALWAALAGTDAARAYRAVAALAARPAEAVPFLKTKLHPVAPLGPTVARLLKDLDSPLFANREKAMLALAQLDTAIAPELERALQGDLPPEARRRVQTLLDRLKVARPGAERRRTLRAIEALELAGTREARQVLRGLTRGVPDDEVTRAAVAALRRLSP